MNAIDNLLNANQLDNAHAVNAFGVTVLIETHKKLSVLPLLQNSQRDVYRDLYGTADDGDGRRHPVLRYR